MKEFADQHLPWAPELRNGNMWDVIDARGRVVFMGVIYGDRKKKAELLAAAPELLQALEQFVSAEEEWRQAMECLGNFDDPLTDAYDAAKRVIAKAKGE